VLADVTVLRATARSGPAGVDLRFSVGFTMTDKVQAVILSLPEPVGHRRSKPTGASVRARTSPSSSACYRIPAAGSPAGMRVKVRRVLP